MKNNNKQFDLEERTAIFGEELIKFCKRIPAGIITNPLISQLVRSGTSVGANYSEARELNLIFNSIFIKLNNMNSK